MEYSFARFQKALTSPFEDPFLLEKVASSVALGSVLAQMKEDGKLHPIKYAIRTINDTEFKYSACEGEALAVMFSLKTFRFYLISSEPIQVITYQQDVKTALSKRNIRGQLERWLVFLTAY